MSNEKILDNPFKSKKNILLFSLIVFTLVIAYISFVSANSFVIEEGSVQNINQIIEGKRFGENPGSVIKVKDKSVLLVDQKGNIYAKKVGKTSITLGNDDKKGNKKKVVKIEVVEPTIGLKPNSLNLGLGEDRRLVAYTVKNRKALLKGTWISENSQNIQVDDTGLMHGLKPGTTYVYYKSENGVTYYTKASVFKTSPFILLTTNSEEVKIGDTNIVHVEFSNDYTGLKEGHWSTTDNTIAKINKDGLIQGKKAGEVLVSFEVKDQEPSFVRIKVIDPKEKGINVGALLKQNGGVKKNGSIIRTNFKKSGSNKRDYIKKVGDEYDSLIDGGSNGISNIGTLDGSSFIETKPELIDVTLNKLETIVLRKEYDIPLHDIKITQSNPNVANFVISSNRDSDNTKEIRIKGFAPGENTVTIQYTKNRIKYINTISIKVTTNEYVPITIVPPSLPLKKGSIGTMVVTGNAEAIAGGMWRSSNTGVAVIDQSGNLKVLGNSGEKCFIIFESNRTGESVKYSLTVI